MLTVMEAPYILWLKGYNARTFPGDLSSCYLTAGFIDILIAFIVLISVA